VWNFKTKRCNKELFGAQKYNITYKTPYAFYNTGPGIFARIREPPELPRPTQSYIKYIKKLTN